MSVEIRRKLNDLNIETEQVVEKINARLLKDDEANTAMVVF